VRDFDRSLAFYRDGLGFPLHDFVEGQRFAMFRLKGSWLSLFPREELAADAGVPDAGVPEDGLGFPGFSLAHNVASREEVDRVYTLALSVDAAARKAPAETFWGGYSGYFTDPEGFLWEVAWNPFTDLT
jgi:hypothetical protein